MDSAAFVSTFRRSAVQLLDALNAASECLDQYNELGAAVTLDPYFTSVTQPATAPLTKQDLIDAGGAIQVLLTALGTGAGSNKAKLDKLR
jgi:hypothetical protein